MDEKDFIEEEGTVSEEDEKMNFAGIREIHTRSSDPEVQSLWSEYKDGLLDIQPDFQRRFVWDKKKSSRLIESVLIGVPLPAIYVAEGTDDNLSVIDGQQRLGSFFNFIDGKFALAGLEVCKELNGCHFAQLDKKIRVKIKKGVLRQITFLKDSDSDLKFEIFKRLNSGAVSLKDQEMRNCVYRGPYNALLHKLSENEDFRKVMGIDKPDKRMKDVEYVLRFSSFYFRTFLHYSSPMKKFMDDEMDRRKDISEAEAADLTSKFKNAAASVFTVLGEKAFRRWIMGVNPPRVRREPKRINESLFDVLMWSFACRDRGALTRKKDSIKEALIHLMTTNPEFVGSITHATSNTQAVQTRFKIWNNELDEILRDEEKQPRCFSRELKQELFDKNPACGICGNQIEHIDDAAVDHIEQYWRGGKTIPENARLAHRHCNFTRPIND